MPEIAIDLQVRNHPGVLSHVAGLFARRAFNVERILCRPEPGGATSRILLTVRDPARLEQVLLQTRKLEDVLAARLLPGDGAEVFGRIAARAEEAPVKGPG